MGGGLSFLAGLGRLGFCFERFLMWVWVLLCMEDDGDEVPESMVTEDLCQLEDDFGIGLAIVVFLARKQGWGVRCMRSDKGGLRLEFDTTSEVSC